MQEERKPVKTSTGESLFDPLLYPQVRDVVIDGMTAGAVWQHPDLIMRLLHLHGIQSYRTLPRRSDMKAQGVDPSRVEATRRDALTVLRTELELAGYLECSGDAAVQQRLDELSTGFPPDASSFTGEELELIEELKERSAFFAIVRENIPGLHRWERADTNIPPVGFSRSTDMRVPVSVAVSVDYL